MQFKRFLYSMSFEVKVAQFEGPFDLLLYFIRRDELDVHDIPIATITQEFLAYIKKMQELNIEIAAEFILVASTLMNIKAKMLLPRKEVDEQGVEIDPRHDLVERLLEYKRYKEVLAQIRSLESKRQSMTGRGNILPELEKLHGENEIFEELHNVDLYKLLKTFHKVLERFDKKQNEPKHVVITYAYTIKGQKEYVMNKVRSGVQLSFVQILSECEDRVQIVFTFLGILEMVQQSLIAIVIGEGFNNFWLESPKKVA